jgi:hypothetical protein
MWGQATSGAVLLNDLAKRVVSLCADSSSLVLAGV